MHSLAERATWRVQRPRVRMVGDWEWPSNFSRLWLNEVEVGTDLDVDRHMAHHGAIAIGEPMDQLVTLDAWVNAAEMME